MDLPPPLRFLEPLSAWAEFEDVFWTHCLEQRLLLEQHCSELKHLIVWLEMHGHYPDRLDTTLCELRECWWDFDDACEGALPFPYERPYCREALEDVIAAAARVCGALEDLADEVPPSAWEGYDDV